MGSSADAYGRGYRCRRIDRDAEQAHLMEAVEDARKSVAELERRLSAASKEADRVIEEFGDHAPEQRAADVHWTDLNKARS